MFLLSLVSFGTFLRILYCMSLMESMGEKKQTFLTTVMNLWVVGMRDWALRFVFNRAISLTSVIDDSKRHLSLNCHKSSNFDHQFIVFSTCTASVPAVSGHIRVVYCLRLLKDSWYASSFLESLKRGQLSNWFWTSQDPYFSSTAVNSVTVHLTYLNNLSYPAIIQLTNSGPVYKGNPGVRVTLALAYFFFFRTSCLQGR